MRRHSVPFTIELCAVYLYSMRIGISCVDVLRKLKYCHDNKTQFLHLKKKKKKKTVKGVIDSHSDNWYTWFFVTHIHTFY